MLKKIEDLPPGVLGIRAEDTLTRDDYETVLVPLLEDAHRRGERICFLYQLGPEFSGFTAGAAIDDFRIGLKYLSLFKKCAVVSDKDWIRYSTQFMGPFMRCPVRSFRNDQMKDAIAWLGSPGAE